MFSLLAGLGALLLAVFVSAMLDPRPSRSGAATGRAHSDDGCDHLSYARARPHTIGFGWRRKRSHEQDVHRGQIHEAWPWTVRLADRCRCGGSHSARSATVGALSVLKSFRRAALRGRQPRHVSVRSPPRAAPPALLVSSC